MELDDELARTLNRSASAVRADAYLDEATERMRDSLRARSSPRRPGGGAPSPRSPTDGIAILLPRDDEGDEGDGDEAAAELSRRRAEESVHAAAAAATAMRRLPPAEPVGGVGLLPPRTSGRGAGAGRGTGARLAAARAQHLAERDEKPVVDWRTPPSFEVAEAVTRLSQPLAVPDPDDGSRSVPFDRNDAELDERGWPTGRSVKGVTPALYPLRETTAEDMGRIGGMGLRLYMEVLDGLAKVFLLLAVASIPGTVAVWGWGGMYAVYDAQVYHCVGANCTEAECCAGSSSSTAPDPPPLAERQAQYAELNCNMSDPGRGTCDAFPCPPGTSLVATPSTAGLTKLTLGNVCRDLDDEGPGPLIVVVLFEIAVSLGLLYLALKASARVKRIKQETDAAMVSMSDYTVQLTPTCVAWETYRKVDSGDGEVVQGVRGIEELSHDVEEALETAVEGARVAEVDGKAMIVAAWDEDELIRKIVILSRLAGCPSR